MDRLIQLQQTLISQHPHSFFLKQKKASTIDQQELKRIVYGPNFKERERCLNIIKSQPQLFEHYHINESSRAHQREMTFRQFAHFKKHLKPEQMADKTNPNQFTLFGNGFAFYDLSLTTLVGVHYSLYLKTIEKLGNSELHNKYYQRACTFQDYGCFALTEIMHGSNVKGLLTEAHYDSSSKQLVIHSPTRDAMKFWIGGAAKVANMCVVWAQLYLNNKCHGVHAIIVPIRDLQTHKVLPGILIGDCGPKFGLNGVDNGFLMFNHFRVPVGNLLNKVSGINEKGQFFSASNIQSIRFGMTLSSLSQGRLFQCSNSTSLSLSALGIAIRYTFVRKQFSAKQGQKQSYLIEYPLTKRRMIPLLALGAIYMCATMTTFYAAENNEEKNIPSNPIIKEIHAISSVLKSRCTWAATEIIRQCRQMMGGHGYSAYSKMAVLYSSHDVTNTWEGENNVLIQQATKYILANFQKAMSGKEIKSPLLKFMSNPPSDYKFQVTHENLKDFEAIKLHLKSNIFNKTQEMGMKMLSMKEKKTSTLQIWNNSQVYMGHLIASMAGDLYVLELCLGKLNEVKDPNTKKVFQNMIHLWSLLVLKNDEFINQDSHSLIESTIMEYCEMLTPELLGIIESITAGEDIMGSPFANQNGQGLQKYMNLIFKELKEKEEEAAANK